MDQGREALSMEDFAAAKIAEARREQAFEWGQKHIFLTNMRIPLDLGYQIFSNLFSFGKNSNTPKETPLFLIPVEGAHEAVNASKGVAQKFQRYARGYLGFVAGVGAVAAPLAVGATVL
jgi:hypothetical protein